MAEYLSDEWFDEASRQLQASIVAPGIERPGWAVHVVVADPSQSEIEYEITFEGDTVSLSRSPEAVGRRPTVRFDVDGDTARGIANGTLSAQRAFMSGTLRVTGDVGLLIEHSSALSGLSALFAPTSSDPGAINGPADPDHA